MAPAALRTAVRAVAARVTFSQLLKRRTIFLSLCFLIGVQLVAVQAFNIEIFPFTTYPMYSQKTPKVLSVHFYCDDRDVSRPIPFRAIWPVSPFYFNSMIAKFETEGRPDLAAPMLQQFTKEAKLLGFEFGKNKRDRLDVDIDIYRDYLIGQSDRFPFERKPCSNL